MNQVELLELVNKYNSIDRQTIRNNLRLLMNEKNFTSSDMVAIGYNRNTVYSWTKPNVNNIPMFEDALKLAIQFKFDITDLLK